MNALPDDPELRALVLLWHDQFDRLRLYQVPRFGEVEWTVDAIISRACVLGRQLDREREENEIKQLRLESSLVWAAEHEVGIFSATPSKAASGRFSFIRWTPSSPEQGRNNYEPVIASYDGTAGDLINTLCYLAEKNPDV